MLESKRKATIFISIAFIFACIAGFLFFRQVQNLNEQLGGTTTVYVAAEDIPSRTPIKEEYLKKMELPNKFVTPSHITDLSSLKNKVFAVPLSSGDLLTKNLLKPVSNVQNPENRLVALYSGERVRFDQDLSALDRVDLVVSQQENGKPVTKVFMKDVLVSAVMQTEGKLVGVGLEVSQGNAPSLIHVQNYADSIRVLKANVGTEQDTAVQSSKDNANAAEQKASNKASDKATNTKQPAVSDAKQSPKESDPS
ncbi:flp pilus assembly protein CpaB [Paenibacillus sp. WLX1005]|uniref:flp pilus assembly protein CpaB n=1 Tax=Paenibacillus sp. WLX1005 TaxID=3243766 RepID=UPI0039842B68